LVKNKSYTRLYEDYINNHEGFHEEINENIQDAKQEKT
jgi:hypothetical protein